jgi:hypothetical protein
MELVLERPGAARREHGPRDRTVGAAGNVTFASTALILGAGSTTLKRPVER